VNIQAIYRKMAPVAASTLVSVTAMASPAVAVDGNKALAQVPGMIPGMVPHPPSSVSQHRGVTHAGKQLTTIDYARLAAKSYPVNRLQRALYLKQQGKVDQALVELLKCAQENPLQVQAFYEQALIFKQKGYNKLAQSSLQQALAVKPEFRDARVLLASLYLEDGDLSHATKELARSLGLDVDKRPAALPANGEALPQATIVQTPHGKLPLPAAPQAVRSPRTMNRVTNEASPLNAAAAQGAAGDAFSQSVKGQSGRNDSQSVNRQTSPATAGDGPRAGSFTVNELSTPQSADEELLKKILGITSPPPPAKPPVVSESTAPDAMHVVQPTAQNGTGDNPLPPGAPGPKVISANSRDAQQLLDQIKKQKKNNSFAWFNPFSWFDKEPAAAVKPAPPPAAQTGKQQHQIVKDVENRMRQATSPHKTRVAGWFDDVRDHLHKGGSPPINGETGLRELTVLPDPEGSGLVADAAAPAQTPAPAHAGNEFNPMRTLTAEPTEVVHQPIFRRLVSWLPLPVFKPLFHKTEAPLPEPKLLTAQTTKAPVPLPVASAPPPPPPLLPPQTAKRDRTPTTLMAPPVPALPQAMATAMTAPTPIVHSGAARNTSAIEQLLTFLPRRVISDIEQAFSPRPVNIKMAGDLIPPPQPADIRHDIAEAPVPMPVAGLNRHVYENLVSARVSSSAMPEASNPLVSPPAPMIITPVHTPARGGAQSPQLDPAAPVDARILAHVQETTLEAQMNKLSTGRVLSPSAVPGVHGGKPTAARPFIKPPLTGPRQYVVNGIQIPVSQLKTEPVPPAVPEDKWTTRMRYLIAHGTGSLGPHEAFLYSEESGQGQLFLADGTVVRRKLALAQTHEEVLRLRRPDIYNSQGELRYNLSLLGKIIKPKNTANPAVQPNARQAQAAQSNSSSSSSSSSNSSSNSSSDDSVNDFLNGSQGIFGWLKNMFKM
jgi:tetratricopeptide (TPR) repeat protein